MSEKIYKEVCRTCRYFDWKRDSVFMEKAKDFPHACWIDGKRVEPEQERCRRWAFRAERKKGQMIYAIDFDGTIVENCFPEIGALKPEAERFIREIRRRGDKWILYTMRGGNYLCEALKFLKEHDLSPDVANDNLPEMCMFYGDNPRKIFANVYIDDHNAGGLNFEFAKKGQKADK